MSAEANPQTPAVDLDFKTVVEESKAALSSQEIVPPKRSRGRPKKEGAPTSPPQKSDAVQTQAPQPPPQIATYLEFPLIAISKGPALKHDIPELALTPEEAKACAEALQACLNAFLPDVNNMSPKTAAVVGVFITVGSIGFTKYQILAEKKAEIAKKQPPKPEPTYQEINEASTVGIDASSYFRR